MFRVASLLG